MYNFPNVPIPKLFPVSEAALLKPWFPLDQLDQALQLLRDKQVTCFHCIRNTTGALIDEEAPVLLQFEKNATLHQGFTIKNHHCSICRRSAHQKGCKHAAALAILSLHIQPKQTKATPIPLGFSQSVWLRIGMFLFEWLNRAPSSIRRIAGEDFSQWEITSTEGLIRVTIPETWAVPAEKLFPGLLEQAEHQKVHKGFTLLNEQLQILNLTESERALAKSGSSSIGWQKENSFWIWLARMLYIFHGDSLPEFHRDPATSRFLLQLATDREAGSLTIVLPRGKTWEFVRNIPLPSTSTAILPAAKECFQVVINADNLLEVTPVLLLKDGRILSRPDLAKNRYPGAYYLEGEGFLPTIRLPVEGTINNPAMQPVMPLLGFLQNEKSRDQPFTVAANDIPAFLVANRKPLKFPDNIVQPELLDLQIRELPDQLFIDSFEERDDWCYLSCHYGLGNTSITLADIMTAKAKNLTSLPGKTWLQIDGTPLSWLFDLPKDRFSEDGSDRIRLSYRELITLTAIIPELEITIKKKSLRKQLENLLDSSRWTNDEALTGTPVHLRSYQRNGLAWLNRLARLGIGGLLADDMGLGKTHQGLALLQGVVNERRGEPMLVICPASVVLNWAEKIDHFYQDLDYALYYGPQRNLSTALDHGLILTTYGIARQDLNLLKTCPFAIILLDEIQHLKNHTTATHQAVAALNGRIKIGLTGTPVENSLQDLRSLFDICLPGLLGSERQFERLYVQPITEGGNNEVRNRLGRLIHPFILRRSRSQVLAELPDVIEDDRICELSDDQVSLYREVIKGQETELVELEGGTTAIPYINILAAITRLKQICCHPCLVQGCDDPAEYTSGKWDLFVELVSELLAADMKFVVFSQYTGMLAIMENYLHRAGTGFASLKGNMPVKTRQKMISDFNTNPDCRVFCASLLAGGIGIDLTGAQAVIHYDRWWNPAREEQATARVHRMGQKNVVQVFRLITKGTLEEKIHQLIQKKRELASSLIQEDEAGIIKQLDRRQIAELFRF